MKPKIRYLFIVICTNMLFFLSNLSYSACVKTASVMTVHESNAAPLNFGKIYYSSNYIQPVGSIIGSIIVPPSHRSLSPETVLWTCDKKDLPNIYFLAATYGRDSFGGHEHLGNGVYATWFRYIGLKQTMDNVTLSRNWQKISIKSYRVENNKIKIRLRDIPTLEATLVKVSNLPNFNPARGGCNRAMAISGTYNRAAIYQGGNGSCRAPSALIQLSGDSTKVSMSFAHDDVGTDSNNSYRAYSSDNGIIFGLGNSNTTLSQDDTCAIRTQKPLINIPTISAIELKKNASVSANFSIELECNENIKFGLNPSQLAMGFLPSANAQTQAVNLKLIANNGASRFLTSENYNHTRTAKGVGLVIQNPKTRANINFLKPSAPSGGGNAAGWYSVIDSNTTTLSTRKSGYNIYNKEYRAVLQKLPNQTPTPGLFKATATILVKIQ